MRHVLFYHDLSMFFYANMSNHVLCDSFCAHVRVCKSSVTASSIAVEYPGDIEQSLQQPSAVNERMESTAFPLNSLSQYWT